MSSVSFDRRTNSRLHLVYFALAFVDILTIVATLLLSQSIMGAYENAVRTSQAWAERAAAVGDLGRLAQRVNAPGNDVFDSGQVEAERARRDLALAAFNAKGDSIERELIMSVSPQERAHVINALADVRYAMDNMVSRADMIFDLIARGQDDEAGRNMASMDRIYAQLTNAIAGTLDTIDTIQLRHLQAQAENAQMLRRLEFLVVGVILLIVICVSIYGNHIGRVLRRDAEEFNKVLEQLERAYAALQHYADNVAHELRSPVNKMMLAAEVTLARARTKDEYAEALASNMEECQRLSSIVEGLLFLARAGSTQVALQRQEISAARELELIRAFYEASAAEAGVSLDVVCEPGARGRVDRVLFQRAVSNLVANAIAHTPSGGSVRIEARQNQAGALEIEVADTGEGIPEEDQPHIFDRFYRADRVRTPAGDRLGLGLPITKSIVDLHRGAVSLESAPGAGARLVLTFPFEESPFAPQAIPSDMTAA